MRPFRLTRETEVNDCPNWLGATHRYSDMIDQGTMNKSLTRRQRQIVELLSEGASDAEIARALGIAERTLRWHLANAHERLGTHSRTQMVAEALRRRILPCPCPYTAWCPLGSESPVEEL